MAFSSAIMISKVSSSSSASNSGLRGSPSRILQFSHQSGDSAWEELSAACPRGARVLLVIPSRLSRSALCPRCSLAPLLLAVPHSARFFVIMKLSLICRPLSIRTGIFLYLQFNRGAKAASAHGASA